MCGILGLLNGDRREGNWGQTYRIMGALFKASESRGRHATGFAAMTDPLDRPLQRIITAKAPLPAREFIEKNGPWRSLRSRRCSAIIGHVRYATHGDPQQNENNHPHSGEHLFLIHNGIVPVDHRELADRFCVRLSTDCDSEVLLRIIEKATTIPIGLSLCLREKPGAIAVLDHRRGTVWLGRDGSRPLWICRLRKDRRLFFASTSGILLAALIEVFGKSEAMAMIEEMVPLASYHVYSASANGTLVAGFEDEIRPKPWTG